MQIFGTFKSNMGNGSFAIFPSTAPEKVNLDRMASQATQTLVNNLKSMGFPAHLCDAAPEHIQTSDLESAIEWITNQIDAGADLPPMARGGGGGGNGGGGAKAPTAEAIAALTSMGFDATQAKLALSQNVRTRWFAGTSVMSLTLLCRTTTLSGRWSGCLPTREHRHSSTHCCVLFFFRPGHDTGFTRGARQGGRP